jgi:hypothetical protein
MEIMYDLCYWRVPRTSALCWSGLKRSPCVVNLTARHGGRLLDRRQPLRGVSAVPDYALLPPGDLIWLRPICKNYTVARR